MNSLHLVLSVMNVFAGISGLTVAFLTAIDSFWDRVALNRTGRNGLLRSINRMNVREALFGLTIELLIAFIALWALVVPSEEPLTSRVIVGQAIYFVIAATLMLLLLPNMWLRRVIRVNSMESGAEAKVETLTITSTEKK